MFPDKEKDESVKKILSKYRFIEIGKQLDILIDSSLMRSVCYLESGYFDTTYLQQYFAAEDANLNSWDYLYDYWNWITEASTTEAVRYYFADESVDLKKLFVIISVLSVSYIALFVSEESIIAKASTP